ncbi:MULTISPECIES: hypothetical protein [Microbacterium]|jgi:hypothetical protein|uniref:hypothetical protein n=1 Tax=Microbacterium TaxID=33882 RepID=UPI001E2F8AB6|nr:hypothetical protein [Microbacterium nymphoidis]MCD2498691.1 hypothetical protein [Microbacterium nymphoidis]
MTSDPEDLDDSTVRASRRRQPVPAETPADLEETVLGQRRRADRAPEPDRDAVEDTVLSARRRGPAPGGSDEPVDDETLLSPRQRPSAQPEPDAFADETLLSSRQRGDDADDTVAVPRRRSTPAPGTGAAPEEDDPILRWSPASSDDVRRSAAPQRTPQDDVIDDQIRRRVASTPEPAILRAPYRPRIVDTPPVNRLEPVAREPREPVNTAAADSRRRADSRRTLIAVIAVGGVIVLAGIAGIVALLTGLL